MDNHNFWQPIDAPYEDINVVEIEGPKIKKKRKRKSEWEGLTSTEI